MRAEGGDDAVAQLMDHVLVGERQIERGEILPTLDEVVTRAEMPLRTPMMNDQRGEGVTDEVDRPFDVEAAKARHEARGRRVREVWIEWAKVQPDPKPSWLVPYDELSEPDKDADRRIGSALYSDGFMDGVNFGLNMARQLAEGVESARAAIDAPTADDSRALRPESS